MKRTSSNTPDTMSFSEFLEKPKTKKLYSLETTCEYLAELQKMWPINKLIVISINAMSKLMQKIKKEEKLANQF